MTLYKDKENKEPSLQSLPSSLYKLINNIKSNKTLNNITMLLDRNKLKFIFYKEKCLI